MNAQRKAVGGSRFLYDSFDLAQARIDAQERVEDERRAGLEYRLGRIEDELLRLEKRLWLAVYGVASGVLVHGAVAFLATQM
ncbi:GTA head formation protein, RCAP_rcc01685 family [Pararhodobacter zhoushanensis]|uniref:GTA head formation protein, RCAP_rcc01685 family n=1 Tax=Pararhodobacter zhoushanensis TaxID=2479545 RepID=UPI000F8D4B69|nr:hypothetical protein [Pararhodobacter zhoushanensis]